MKVFSVLEMEMAEKAANAAGLHYLDMMETAGKRIADVIKVRYPVKGMKILILVGSGNNGGDGLGGRALSG